MGWPELIRIRNIRIRNSSYYPLNSYNHSIRPLGVLSYLPVKGLCGFRIMEYRSVYYAQYSEHFGPWTLAALLILALEITDLQVGLLTHLFKI